MPQAPRGAALILFVQKTGLYVMFVHYRKHSRTSHSLFNAISLWLTHYTNEWLLCLIWFVSSYLICLSDYFWGHTCNKLMNEIVLLMEFPNHEKNSVVYVKVVIRNFYIYLLSYINSTKLIQILSEWKLDSLRTVGLQKLQDSTSLRSILTS